MIDTSADPNNQDMYVDTNAQITRRAMLLAALLVGSRLPAAPEYGWIRHFAEIPPDLVIADAAGRHVDLAGFRGRPLLVNLWATWCAPCLVELPALDRFACVAERDGSVVAAVALDREGWPAVRPLWKRLHLGSVRLLLDPARAFERVVAVAGLPMSLAVDASGALCAYRRGALDWDSPVERDVVRGFLRT